MKNKTLILFIIGFVYIMFLSVFDNNSLIINRDFKRGLNILFPQGWGFFTKNPREENYTLFKMQPNGNFKQVTIKNNSLANSLGLSRKSRKIGSEMSIMLATVNDSLWTTKPGSDSLISYTDNFVDVERNKLITTLDAGNYIIVRKELVPWAWINNVSENDGHYKFVGINLCNE